MDGTVTEALLRSGALMGKTAGIVTLFLLACAFGLTLFRVAKIPAVPALWAFAFGLGLAILSLGTFFIAVLQQANLYGVGAMLLPTLYTSRHELRRLYKLIIQRSISLPLSFQTRWLWILWIFILSMFELEFISSSATLLNADYDAFHQYLTFPMEYLQHGGFTSFLWHPSWGFPQLGEMLFLLTAILFGLSGPFLANQALMVIMIAVLFQSMKKADSVHSAPMRHWLTATMASSPTILALGSGALKIEMAFYLYSLLVILLVKIILTQDRFTSFGNRHLNGLFGVFLGIILSIKYTAFFIVLAIFIALWILLRKNRSFYRGAFSALGLAFFIMSPWFIKNWMVYKSPLYPIFQGRDQFFLETGNMCSPYQYNTHDVILLLSNAIYQIGLPVLDNLQIFIYSIANIATSKSMQYPGLWVAIFLGIMIYDCFRWKTTDVYERFLILFLSIFFVGWLFFLLGGMWYLFPAWFALVIFMSERTTGLLVKRIVITVAIFSVLIGWLSVFNYSALSIQYANRDITLSEGLTKKGEDASGIESYAIANDLLNRDMTARIYSFQDPIGYFIDNSSRRFVMDYYGERFRCLGTNAEIKASLKGLGVQYILANTRRKRLCEQARNPESNEICRSVSRFESFLEEESLPVIFSKERMTLYQL
jgi:hypothetical protein